MSKYSNLHLFRNTGGESERERQPKTKEEEEGSFKENMGCDKKVDTTPNDNEGDENF